MKNLVAKKWFITKFEIKGDVKYLAVKAFFPEEKSPIIVGKYYMCEIRSWFFSFVNNY